MNDFIVLHPLKKWYIVAANRWIIVAANPRYIYVRELTIRRTNKILLIWHTGTARGLASDE